MFTLEQIYEAGKKVKSGADFPQMVQDLKAIGVSHYDNYVANGCTLYYGADGFVLEAAPKYPDMNISPTGSEEKLKHALAIHQKGETDYPTFCQDAANAGVEKWTTHMLDMSVRYYDNQGQLLVEEIIPQV